jgi:hypothetical protein
LEAGGERLKEVHERGAERIASGIRWNNAA